MARNAASLALRLRSPRDRPLLPCSIDVLLVCWDTKPVITPGGRLGLNRYEVLLGNTLPLTNSAVLAPRYAICGHVVTDDFKCLDRHWLVALRARAGDLAAVWRASHGGRVGAHEHQSGVVFAALPGRSCMCPCPGRRSRTRRWRTCRRPRLRPSG